MQPEEIRTLKILEEIEKDIYASQRTLSRRLNISLGLVNSFVRRLSQKGYFKVKTIPKNRVKYILTPKGIREKSRLTYKYLQSSFQFYRESRRKIQLLLKAFEQQGVRSVAILGKNDCAEIVYLSLRETNIRIGAVLDQTQIGERFFEYTVNDPQAFDYSTVDKVIVTNTDQQDVFDQYSSITENPKNRRVFCWLFST